MKQEKLNFNHKKILSDSLKNLNYSISEYSFLDLYLFREKHDYQVLAEKEIFISGISFDGFRYLMPVFDLQKSHLNLLKKTMEGFDFLFPIPESKLFLFQSSEFSIEFKTGDSDYLFETSRFKEYAGRKLQKKRNFVHQFMKNYQYRSESMNSDNIKDACIILETWQHQSKLPREMTDFYACKECLNKFDQLPVMGEIYYADGIPCGFIIGEALNHEVFDFHFAKGNHLIKGIYPFMYQNFTKNLNKNFRYLNFEQDLDKEELRKAKSSFFPDQMLKKYRIYFKKN